MPTSPDASSVYSLADPLLCRGLILSHRDGVFWPPRDFHISPMLLERLCRGRLEVLDDHLKLPTAIKLDDVARDHSRVGHADDPARLDLHPVRRLAVGEDADLLWADREAVPAPLEHIR